MKLDALKFGLAAAIVTAALWLVSRGIMLLALPAHPMATAGYMMGPRFHHPMVLGWAGFVVGLVLWPLVAGAAAWATAAVYNRLVARGEANSSKSSD